MEKPDQPQDDDADDPFEFDRWVAEVRDPAKAASEGVRTLKVKDAEASYEVAQLTGGRWALRFKCEYRTGDVSSFGTPWRAFATREECVAHFLAEARRHFRDDPAMRRVTSQTKAGELMLQKIREGLLFREPPAVPRPKEEPGEDPVKRLQAERKRKLIEEMPLFADMIENEE